MSFSIQTDEYQGPISLLLSLISAQKVDLWNLSISELVDAYLDELEMMRKLDLEIATEFLVVASTLLELKCRRLFPNSIDFEPEEEFAFFEERDLLIARLLEVKTYRDASVALTNFMNVSSLSIAHEGFLDEPYQSMMPDILAGVSPERLKASLERFIQNRIEQEVDISHLPPHTISIAQAARNVVVRLSELRDCSFEVLMDYAESSLEVIVGFLAVLELYRQNRIELHQKEFLGDLMLKWSSSRLSDEEIQDFLSVSGFEA